MGWGKKLGIGCGVVLAFFIVLGVSVFFIVRGMTAAPEQAVHEFLDAAAAGDYAKAHGYFSVPLKERKTLEAFAADVRSGPSLFSVADSTFTDRSIDTAGAKLSGTLTLKAGTKVPASFSLVQESGAWKLLSYELGSK